MVATGDPGRVLGLVDPDSDLREALERTGRGVVVLLGWADRGVAEMFAGAAPAPGGLFAQASFTASAYGPRLSAATTWLTGSLVEVTGAGWSDLVTMSVEEVSIGEDSPDSPDGQDDGGRLPLEHRRGRYLRPAGPEGPAGLQRHR